MRVLRENLNPSSGLKLFALAGAIAVWVTLAGQPLSDASFDARVHYVNVPEHLELNPDQAERVTVILRGTRPSLRALRDLGVGIEADFSDVYAASEKTLTVAEMNLGLPEGVHLVKAVPSQLRFTLEARAERTVEIQPQFVGSYERDYALDAVLIEPREMMIVGPENRVTLIDVVTTDPIDLTDVVGSRSFRVTAYLPDPYVRFARDPTVTVEVRMRKRE